MTWHPVNDSLEISLLGALWAGEGTKTRMTICGHTNNVLGGTDKLIDQLVLRIDAEFHGYSKMSVFSPRLWFMWEHEALPRNVDE